MIVAMTVLRRISLFANLVRTMHGTPVAAPVWAYVRTYSISVASDAEAGRVATVSN